MSTKKISLSFQLTFINDTLILGVLLPNAYPALTLVSSVTPEIIPEFFIYLFFLCYNRIKDVISFYKARLGMLAR